MKAQAEIITPKPTGHVPLRPKVVRHERELTVDEAIAELKRLVPRR
jgi:hypothetical protein